MVNSRFEQFSRTVELSTMVGGFKYFPRLYYERKLGNSQVLRVNVRGIGTIFTQSGTDHLAVMSEVLGSSIYALPYYNFDRLQDTEIRVLDLGANIGISTLKLDAQIRASGKIPKIVAVEPHPTSFGFLQMNCSVGYRYRRIKPIGKAISQHSGQCMNLSPIAKPNCYSVYKTTPIDGSPYEPEGITVETVSPQDLIDTYFNGLPPHIIKIDIEGAEAELFAGDNSWIAETPIIYIERHDFTLPHQPSFTPAQEALDQYGFQKIPYYGNDVDLLFVKD